MRRPDHANEWAVARPARLLTGLLLLAGLSCSWDSKAPTAPQPPATGSLAVYSNPPGASIIVDDVNTQRVTPDTLDNWTAGEHVVRIELAGFAPEPAATTVTVASGILAQAHFDLEEILMAGSIFVTSTPEGAAIRLDGNDTGRVSPDTLAGLTTGVHEVTVELAGYSVDPPSASVIVKADATVDVHFDLEELIPDRIVFIEHFTNANCPPCREVDPFLELAIEQFGERLVTMGNHMYWPGADPFYDANPIQLEARRARLGVQKLPKFWVDGVEVEFSIQDYNAFVSMIEGAASQEPAYRLAVTATPGADSVIVNTTLERLGATAGDDLLMVVVIETGISYRDIDGFDLLFDDVVRNYMSGPNGEAISLDQGVETAYRHSAPIGSGWNIANLEAVAFIQSNSSGVVYQSESTRRRRLVLSQGGHR